MKITKNGLKQIIKEELDSIIKEHGEEIILEGDDFDGQTGLPVTAKGLAMVQKQGGKRWQQVMSIIATSVPQKLFDALLQTKEGSAALRNQKSKEKSGAPGSQRAAKYGGGTVSDDPAAEKYMRDKAALDYVTSRNS